MQRLSHFLPGFFHMSRSDMPDFDLFGHAYNAYWFFLVTQLNAFIKTHDWFFEDIEKRLVPILMEGMGICDLRKKVAAFQTEFGSEKDLFRVLVIVSSVVIFERHGRYNYYCILPIVLSFRYLLLIYDRTWTLLFVFVLLCGETHLEYQKIVGYSDFLQDINLTFGILFNFTAQLFRTYHNSIHLKLRH